MKINQPQLYCLISIVRQQSNYPTLSLKLAKPIDIIGYNNEMHKRSLPMRWVKSTERNEFAKSLVFPEL